MRRSLNSKKCIALVVALTLVLQLVALPGSFVFADGTSGNTGLEATYYSDSTFSDQASVVKGVNIDSDLWAQSSNAKGDFSVVWKGAIIPKFSETYTFYAVSNGTFKVTINDVLVFNVNSGKDIMENRFTMESTFAQNKKYSIKVEYSHTGDTTPVADLLWMSASQSKEIVPKTAFVSGVGEAFVAPYPYFSLGADSLKITPTNSTYSSTTDTAVKDSTVTIPMTTETTSYLANINAINSKASYVGGYNMPANWSPDSELKSETLYVLVNQKEGYSNKVLVTATDNNLTTGSAVQGVREWKATDPSKTADLSLQMYVKNEGEFTVTNVKPSFIVKLGKKELGNVTASEIESIEAKGKALFDTPSISLTVDEVRAIENGAPITIEFKNVYANVEIVDEVTGAKVSKESTALVSALDSSTAEIVMDNRNGVIKKKRVVVANANGTATGVTLGEALSETFGVSIENGNVFIDNAQVNTNWKINVASFNGASDSKVQYDDFIAQLTKMNDNDRRIMDTVLVPGMQITFVKYLTDPVKSTTDKTYWASYSQDFRNIYVCIPEVEAGRKAITVTANVKINNENKQINLSSNNGSAFYSYPLLDDKDKFNLMSDANVTVTLQDELKQETTVDVKTVSVPMSGVKCVIKFHSDKDYKRKKMEKDPLDALAGLVANASSNILSWLGITDDTEKDNIVYVYCPEFPEPTYLVNTDVPQVKDLDGGVEDYRDVEGYCAIRSFDIIESESSCVVNVQFFADENYQGVTNIFSVDTSDIGLGDNGAESFKIRMTK